MPRLALLSLTCAFALLAGGCDRQSEEAAQQKENSAAAKAGEELTGLLDRSQAGQDLPEAVVTDLAGVKFDLAKPTGRPMLLNLWATWCAPCIAEMPLLNSLAGELKGKVDVVTVSEDMKGAELVGPFLEGKGWDNLPSWMDPENDLAFGFGGGASLPLTVLYDAQGKEVWRVIGGYDWGSPEARGLIDEALANDA
ncbi:TlpA family protein disulfide reductase [Tsuneonella sp. HG222]